mmetsp:Transcript_17145/g.30789  ORF Transcript_17145/g.30789 Transcript_17145/m.30789 type:complete len:393 (-) Transcript_17145:12840-14018(-)
MAVRLYTPADDAALKALELKLVEPTGDWWPYSKIKLGPVYIAPYATKAQLFPDNVILVAEEQGKIVGTVSAGIKKAAYTGEMIPLACVFDLKTFPESKDLEHTLLTELEKILISKQVVAMYSYIAEENEATLELYKKLNYDYVSERSIRVKTRKGLPMKVDVMPKDEALKFTKETYEKKAMIPEDIEAIFDSPFYKGTFSIQDIEGNLGALSLWDCSVRSRQTVLECCTDPKSIRRYWQLYLIFFAAVLLFHLWFLFFLFELVEEQLLQLVVFAFGFFTFVRVFTVGFDLYNYFRLTFRNQKSRRARTFGLCYRGKYAQREDLLRRVVEGTISKAITSGFDSVAFNIDSSDNDYRVYPNTKSKAVVMLKRLYTFQIGRWSPQSFQDPRELSL